MEDELRCSNCKQLFVNPVLLPCYHALCLACGLDLQVPSSTTGVNSVVHHSLHLHQQHSQSSSSSVSTGSSSATESVSSDQDQADKVSILSEADSGVICTSRPNSYAGTPNLQGLLFPPSGSVYSLACPVCRKIVFFDESGARNLPPYRAMESIVDRFCEREALRCQMCESDTPKVASVACEQCEIRYCEGCRELCHPSRGPLAKHNLIRPRGASQVRESVCSDHSEPLSIFCCVCKVAICSQCSHHNSHDKQPITQSTKAQKVSLICQVFFSLNYYSWFLKLQKIHHVRKTIMNRAEKAVKHALPDNMLTIKLLECMKINHLIAKATV